MSRAAHLRTMPTSRDIMAMLESVPDPEIPALSVIDLGLVRDVTVGPDGVEVSVAPTYTGCPATEVIERMIAAELEQNGLTGVSIKRVLSPPWTTDWLTDSAREKLRAYGIAPPAGSASKQSLLAPGLKVSCPRCSAVDTTRVSEFGSTPCKASYKCNACLEPFEYFKCI
ncbi:MAG TPA: 1,2-phenylacetyl-CoA epoxidase subunit PaaD [Woeseiaceae bacterium]|nr:1,2-phenylacetyl-CoA epoxidase subunit PaaD [Woeseiaceae bacterium]